MIWLSVKADDLPNGQIPIPDPMNVDPELVKMGIQSTRKHFANFDVTFHIN